MNEQTKGRDATSKFRNEAMTELRNASLHQMSLRDETNAAEEHVNARRSKLMKEWRHDLNK